ncbi:MAG TPA: SRPBCC domain-containing protein, partial [Kiloniellales bacterium]|nr:SRPBCC domain-containing protein [Kiloniellales bacterium]
MNATLQKIEPLVMHRQFAAPPARVYAAWTDASLFGRWFGPPGGSVTRCEMDARVGGRWRTEVRSSDGKDYGVSGVFKVLEPPKRIVLSWIWDDRPAGAPDMEIDITLTPRGEGTEMTFR